MHSFIIQLQKEPVNRGEYIVSCEYEEHWFTRLVADYTYDFSFPRDAIAVFLKRLGGAEKYTEQFADRNGFGVIFKEGFRKAYFDEQYVKLRAAIQKLSDAATVDSFRQGSLTWLMCDLRRSYDDKHGIYVESDGDLITLNHFVRDVLENTCYYFGGVVGYHY